MVVADDEFRRLARHVGARLAHGHADVGRTQRRRVVDAVARDRDEVPGLAGRVDDLQLLVRRHARKYPGACDETRQRLRRRGDQVRAGDDFVCAACKL